MNGFAFSPQSLGMPPKFKEWRRWQSEALETAIGDLDEFRFAPNAMPTGMGKSPWYMALKIVTGWRTVILTKTKALQSQLMNDFSSIGLVDIRGRNNYSCQLGEGYTCEDGQHARCPLMRDEKCPYFAARTRALASGMVVTNYSYWPMVNKYGEGLGKFDLIVLDEAAEAPQAVCAAMSTTFTSRDVYQFLRSEWPPDPLIADLETWKDWAATMLAIAQGALDKVKKEIAQYGADGKTIWLASTWADLARRLENISTARGEWATDVFRGGENEGGSGYVLEPLWADCYAEEILFHSIEHVVLVSATLRRKTLTLLGVQPREYFFREYPYIFPVGNAPIYYVPTAHMGRKATPLDLIHLFYRMDEFIGARLDRKGLIHCPSYQLRDHIMRDSIHSKIMFSHERNSVSTEAAVNRLKSCPAPAVLVSPVLATGYDFPGSACEYQLIPKLPFVQTKGSRIMAARCDGDPEYADYLMVQQLQQACGRINRSPEDQGETVILDSNLGEWVIPRCRRQFASWFFTLYRPWRKSELPVPPPPLGGS